MKNKTNQKLHSLFMFVGNSIHFYVKWEFNVLLCFLGINLFLLFAFMSFGEPPAKPHQRQRYKTYLKTYKVTHTLHLKNAIILGTFIRV